MKLYMLLLGCKPLGRHTEQHDIFFGVADALKDLVPAIKDFWPEAKDNIHIDAWREVNYVDGYAVHVTPRNTTTAIPADSPRLFFLNLGGYKENEFDEFHYRMLIAASEKGAAIRQAKQTAFYQHTGFKGAESHIDDKYGVDVDDLFEIEEVLPESIKANYTIRLHPQQETMEDTMHLGYFRLNKL